MRDQIAEIIPWERWLESVATETLRDERFGRHVFQQTCMWAHSHVATGSANAIGFTYPIALRKYKGAVTALATEDILQGCLVIPVFCMRDSSYLSPDMNAVHVRSNHEVKGLVKWKQPVDEASGRDVVVTICCQPERKQPIAKENKGPPCYDHNTDCHPFWHIRRSMCVGEFNSAIVGVEVKVIVSSPMKELKTDDYQPESGCCDTAVTVPCIVNTEKIASGKEIVLKWDKDDGNRTGDGSDWVGRPKRVITAFNLSLIHI